VIFSRKKRKQLLPQRVQIRKPRGDTGLSDGVAIRDRSSVEQGHDLAIEVQGVLAMLGNWRCVIFSRKKRKQRQTSA